MNKGASAANMSLADFKNLDYALANWFVNPPKAWVEDDVTGEGKLIPINESIEVLKKEVRDGTITLEDAKQTILDGRNLDPAVKVYLINQLPVPPEQKDGWIESSLKWLKSKV
jgi:hypothetical protein